MRRLALTCLIILGFAVPMTALRALPMATARTAALRDLLHAADCAPPCFLGIHVGVTPLDEALARLRAHPWVTTVFYAGRPGMPTYWGWADSFPFRDQVIGTSAISLVEAGEQLEFDDIWDTIDLVTTIPLGDLVAALGPPDHLAVNLLAPLSRRLPSASSQFVPSGGARLIIAYDDGITLTSDYLTCPVDISALWQATTIVTFGNDALQRLGTLYPLPDSHWPRWFVHRQPGERCA